MPASRSECQFFESLQSFRHAGVSKRVERLSPKLVERLPRSQDLAEHGAVVARVIRSAAGPNPFALRAPG